MDPDLRKRSETGLLEAAARLGLADPRPPMRERLRRLRETHADALANAVRHYEQAVLPSLVGGDAIGTWLEYGRFVGELTSAGRLHVIDAYGRAAVYKPPLASGVLVLFLPDDTSSDVLVVASPLQCTPAQQATLTLLVDRSLALREV
jgi:hypothetical protein